MTQQEVVTYWLDKAKDELKSADIMFNAGQNLYMGFMCHQAIEKALKAYYVFLKDERQPHEHNLFKLLTYVELFDATDDLKKNTIEKLNPLYVKTRYEDYKNTISSLLTNSYCKALLAETKELLAWITELMNL